MSSGRSRVLACALVCVLALLALSVPPSANGSSPAGGSPEATSAGAGSTKAKRKAKRLAAKRRAARRRALLCKRAASKKLKKSGRKVARRKTATRRKATRRRTGRSRPRARRKLRCPATVKRAGTRTKPRPASTPAPAPAPVTAVDWPSPQPSTTGPPVSFPSRLATSGTHIVDSNLNPVQLKGFNVIPIWSSSPGQTWGVDYYSRIAQRGFNAVRLVVYWSDLEPRRGEFNQTHLATLDKAVGHAKAAGLYVILDPIHIFQMETYVPAWARTGDVLRDVEQGAGPYTTMLAARYRDEPAVAAYDPLNEPPASTSGGQERVMRIYGWLIAKTRAAAPDKIVMVEPAWGDSSLAEADIGLLGSTRNVVLSLHDYYAGGAGDGYKADGSQEGFYAWDEVGGYPIPDAAALEQHLSVTLNVARRAGMPVWIGEFGVNHAAVNADLWIDQKVALFKKYGLGYAWWIYQPGSGLSAMDSSYALRPYVDRLL